jgi:hypothetical protein
MSLVNVDRRQVVLALQSHGRPNSATATSLPASAIFTSDIVVGFARMAIQKVREQHYRCRLDQLRSAERIALSGLFFFGILMLMIATLALCWRSELGLPLPR